MYKLPRYREKEGAEMELNEFYFNLKEFIKSMKFNKLSEEDVNAMWEVINSRVKRQDGDLIFMKSKVHLLQSLARSKRKQKKPEYSNEVLDLENGMIIDDEEFKNGKIGKFKSVC